MDVLNRGGGGGGWVRINNAISHSYYATTLFLRKFLFRACVANWFMHVGCIQERDHVSTLLLKFLQPYILRIIVYLLVAMVIE
jgi:hypothetical protein